MTDPEMTDLEKLERVLEMSGMSAQAFAKDILIRDGRTMRRWLAGDSPIPAAVVEFLDAQLAADARRGPVTIRRASGE